MLINPVVDKYIAGVIDGTVVVGPWIRKAIDRHLDDLEHGHERGLWFDPAAANHVIDFCQMFCTPSNQHEPMTLFPAQQTWLAVLYGWKKSDGTRRFRRSFYCVAKKNGKSGLSSALALYHLIADGERSARVFCAATTMKQARTVFKEACMMRSRSADLKAAISQSGIEPVTALYVLETGSRLSPLARDAASEDGLICSAAICDELHRWTSHDLWTILRYGGRTRTQPMLIALSTAGGSAGGTTMAWSEFEYGMKVLDRVVIDDEYCPWFFTLDPKDNWRDEQNWVKANPALGHLFPIDTIRKEFQETEGKPSSRGEFLRFCLNIWSSESENPAIEITKWDACCREAVANHPDAKRLRSTTLSELKGRACFGAVDLAPKLDTSALILLFPPLKSGERWRILEYFWCPKDNIADRVKRDRVPYDRWAEDGYITPTEGNLTDVRFIADQITEINKLFDLREIAYDSSWSSELIRMLSESGFPMEKFVGFPQTHAKMNGPCLEFVRKVLRKEFAHDHNPVMRWQVSSLRWNTQKTTGFIRPDRTRKREKIDGPASLIMALARATDPDNVVRPKKQFAIFTSQ